MKETRVIMVVGSNGIGRLLAEKMRTEGVGLVLTVAPRLEVTRAEPRFHGMQKIDPREHDKKCWKYARRYRRQ